MVVEETGEKRSVVAVLVDLRRRRFFRGPVLQRRRVLQSVQQNEQREGHYATSSEQIRNGHRGGAEAVNPQRLRLGLQRVQNRPRKMCFLLLQQRREQRYGREHEQLLV